MCYLLVCRWFVPLVILGDMSLRDMLLVINCVSVICDIFYLDVWFSKEPHTRSIVDQERNLQSPRPSQDHQPPPWLLVLKYPAAIIRSALQTWYSSSSCWNNWGCHIQCSLFLQNSSAWIYYSQFCYQPHSRSYSKMCSYFRLYSRLTSYLTACAIHTEYVQLSRYGGSYLPCVFLKPGILFTHNHLLSIFHLFRTCSLLWPNPAALPELAPWLWTVYDSPCSFTFFPVQDSGLGRCWLVWLCKYLITFRYVNWKPDFASLANKIRIYFFHFRRRNYST